MKRHPHNRQIRRPCETRYTTRGSLSNRKRVCNTRCQPSPSQIGSTSLGGRQIEILNFGRGVTPGDALMYLPKERVVVTGDLLVNPITFAMSSYRTEWLRALETVDALGADVIVTGHGEPLRDRELLHATIDVFRELLKQGKDARDRGLDPDQAKDD
ncbi:MAG: MBL fold metallo-hydrolase, partial [Acidobacteria bacterium]|nr:MBL fold metallo-hydrolase [Acidobacteriota bacterium]